MAKTPLISHTVNGYSRFDQPTNVGFTATPGLLYPANTLFLNARDCVYVQAGAVVRANPTVVPTFTPYQIRLHRFFIPMQLYHPEMRVNSSGFDMQNLSMNYLNISFGSPSLTTNPENPGVFSSHDASPATYVIPGSLLDCLDLAHGGRSYYATSTNQALTGYRIWHAALTGADIASSLSTSGFNLLGRYIVNADPVLGYWDIVRNYYGFSQNGLFSFAQRGVRDWGEASSASTEGSVLIPDVNGEVFWSDNTAHINNRYWRQWLGDLSILDRFYETSFYPKDGSSGAFDYTYLSNVLFSAAAANPSSVDTSPAGVYKTYPAYNITSGSTTSDVRVYLSTALTGNWPLAVCPSSPDRFSRLLDPTASPAVSMLGVQTVTQLAVAARLQEYRDLLGAGGSRFSDWLQTFFAAKVQHVDRPILVYSSSFYLNSSPIFNQQGQPGQGLGEYGGVIQGQDSFGKKRQRYCFDEPGYLMDLVSIRPLYYWSGIQADYARYNGLDYFNPIFNEVGYQTVPASTFSFSSRRMRTNDYSFGKEPCFGEFRSSYDRVFGDFEVIPSLPADVNQPNVIYNSWVMQRSAPSGSASEAEDLSNIQSFRNLSYFVELSTVNRPFTSDSEDNFFVNMYYRITRKTLVSKNFATRLATR